MTAQDIVRDRARHILDDTDSGSYRWTDALLFDFLNDGVQCIANLRPDALLTGNYTRGEITEVTLGGNDIDIDDGNNRYRDALVDYVCSRAFAIEAQDRRDLARADSHARAFTFKTGLPMPRMLSPERRG